MNGKVFGEKHNVAKDTENTTKDFHRYRRMFPHRNRVFFGRITCTRGSASGGVTITTSIAESHFVFMFRISKTC
jgi:hypothetical protein